MNGYEAMMKAADFIERNPKQYDFRELRVPPLDGCGCMWGWTGHFLGISAKESIARVEDRLGMDMGSLYVFGLRHPGHTCDSKIAANLMRDFARKHLQPQSGVPAELDPAFLRFRDSLALVDQCKEFSSGSR